MIFPEIMLLYLQVNEAVLSFIRMLFNSRVTRKRRGCGLLGSDVIKLQRIPLLGELLSAFFLFILIRAETHRLYFLPFHGFVFHGWLHDFSQGRGCDE